MIIRRCIFMISTSSFFLNIRVKLQAGPRGFWKSIRRNRNYVAFVAMLTGAFAWGINVYGHPWSICTLIYWMRIMHILIIVKSVTSVTGTIHSGWMEGCKQVIGEGFAHALWRKLGYCSHRHHTRDSAILASSPM